MEDESVAFIDLPKGGDENAVFIDLSPNCCRRESFTRQNFSKKNLSGQRVEATRNDENQLPERGVSRAKGGR